MKAKSTTKDMPAYTEKRSRLGGVKTVAGSTGKDDNDSGGDRDQHAIAKRMTKGMKPGIGLPNGPGPKPFAERKGSGGYKIMADRGKADSGGGNLLNKATCDAWCQGKRSSYK